MSFLGRNIGRALTQTTKAVCSNLLSKTNPSIQSLSKPLSILTNGTNKYSGNSSLCSCKCGIKGMHTRGDRELVEFLQEEIIEEKKTVVHEELPAQIGEYSVKRNKAELILERKFHDETITITLNVNHSVDIQNDESPDAALESRPDFEVDIETGSSTLSFTCSYVGQEEAPADTQGTEEQNTDVFGITEVTFYKGEFSDENYCVSGESLDAKLYDLFMNALNERGVSNDFANILIDVSTSHEHSLYIDLLENVQQFFKKK